MNQTQLAIQRTLTIVVVAVLFLPGLAVQASTSTAAYAEEPERCVQISRIDSVDILNRSQIVFETIGDDLYVNELPHPCPGLRTTSTIMYRTSIDLLCDVDIITVVDPMGGGLFPSGSCGLGKFYPISEQELQDVKEQSDA